MLFQIIKLWVCSASKQNPMCQYRAVGHPIAVAITEALIDKATYKIDMDIDKIKK